MKKILLMIPAYNEAENIGALLKQMKEAGLETSMDILVIDDCSRDGTSEIQDRGHIRAHGIERRVPHVEDPRLPEDDVQGERQQRVQAHVDGHFGPIGASNHDFHKTPAKSDIIYRLRKMQDMGADIPKIAVMPQNKRDVLTLLAATEEMVTDYADRPVITMSMAGTGVISRLCGEVFGSSMTFGAAKKASAPGQMGVEDLSTVLGLLHKSM